LKSWLLLSVGGAVWVAMELLIFFTPDRPELQLQLREFAGDMKAKPTATAQTFRSGATALEFEVIQPVCWVMFWICSQEG
jgi:hypothetical protein